MNIIADSNIFIAAWHKRDTNNELAIQILNQFENREIRTICVANYVIVEVVNFLLKKIPFELVLEAYEYLTQTEGIEIIYVDKIMEYEIKNLFLKYKTLTLTDCSLIALAKELSIKYIYSFDNGFDKAKEITRLEKPL